MPETASAATPPTASEAQFNDTPNPVKATVKVVSARENRASQAGTREGKALPDRRAAAVKILEKADPVTAAPKARASAAAIDEMADRIMGTPEEPAAPAAETSEEPSPERAAVLARRAAAKRRLADLDAKKAKLRDDFTRKQEEARARSELEQREANLRRESELAQLAKEKPFDYLQKVGVKPADLVKQAVDEGDPQVAVLKRLEAAEARLAEEARARDEWTKAERERAFFRDVEAYEAKFFEPLKSSPQDFPTIRRYSRDYIQQRCRKFAQDYHKEIGVYPGTPGAEHSHADVLTAVQDLISQEEAAEEATQPAPTAPGANREGPRTAATITGSLSARTRTAQARALTREQRIERAKGILRAGTRR